MITPIVNLFRNQAREHKAVKAFYYNRNYELGQGSERHPLLWLEDPVMTRNRDNIFTVSVNFSVLLIPDKELSVIALQNIAFSIGLNIIERIKKNTNDYGVSIINDWTGSTLRNYYDNNTCGFRFSLNFNVRNMQDLCLIDEQFDKDKIFPEDNILPDFDTNPSDGCVVFANKLPVFDLKIKK